MTPALLFALVPLMVDETPRHFHFSAAQLPQEAASAFVQACEERNPFPSDPENKLCAVFLLVMAGEESRFQLHIVGDGGKAVGPFQEHTGGEARDRSWLSSTRHYLHLTIPEAMRQCPEQVIARLAGERCGSSEHHARRWAQITRLLHEPAANPTAP
jgi:hypothetical protein